MENQYGILELSGKKGHYDELVIAKDSTSVKSKMLFPDRKFKKYPEGTLVKYEITNDKGNYAFVKTYPVKTGNVDSILNYFMKIGYFATHSSCDFDLYQDDHNNIIAVNNYGLIYAMIDNNCEQFYCHEDRDIYEYPKWKNVSDEYRSKIDELHKKYNDVLIRPLRADFNRLFDIKPEFLKDMINAYGTIPSHYYIRPHVSVNSSGVFKFARSNNYLGTSDIYYVYYHEGRNEMVRCNENPTDDVCFKNIDDIFIDTFKQYHITTVQQYSGYEPYDRKATNFESETLYVLTILPDYFNGELDEKVEESWKDFEQDKISFKKYVNQRNASDYMALNLENILGLDGWLEE